MQYSTLLLAFAATVIASPQALKRAACNADNCARAVTGTQAGLPRQSSRLSDCSSYQTTTVVPSITTTLTITGTEPAYAEATCTGSPTRYASACSCAGITAATSTSTIAPTGTPTGSFRIANKGTNGQVTLTGLNVDGQTYGNTGDKVLSQTGDQVTYTLTGTTLMNSLGQTAYSFSGDASKLYFSSTGAPVSAASSNYPLYSCSFGAYDGSVPGYALNCYANQNPSDNYLFYQGATGNYGFGPAGFSGDATGTGQPGPDIPGGQLYAVSAS